MITIIIDDLSSPEIKQLLKEHLASMHQHCPKDSIHAFDIETLRQPDITFWSAWDGKQLCGCAALKKHNEQHAELKSMRTASKHLRRGIARQLLKEVLDYAKQQGYSQISLETGSQAIFIPARKLYTSVGFKPCAPFAAYKEDPNSIFMTKYL